MKEYNREFNRIFSDYFLELRKQKGRNFEEVAQIVKVKPNTFYQYEQGSRECPIDVFQSLCKYYNIDYYETLKTLHEKALKKLLGSIENDK